MENKLIEMEATLNAASSWFDNYPLTNESLNEFLLRMKNAFPNLNLVDAYDRINAMHMISMVGNNSKMDDGTHEEWFNETIDNGLNREIEWHYWKFYEQYLKEKKRIPKSVVTSMAKVTSEILAKLEDPEREGPWDRRGLVMGSVQSGKTGNYTGLVAKALDSGYKFIVVLTGTHNSLRTQTQIRLNDELLGFDTEKVMEISNLSGHHRIGVSKRYPEHRGWKDIQTLTTKNEKGDFKKKQATSVSPRLDSPNVLIIKKNTSILKNLNEWIGVYANADGGKVRDSPLLVIDDECDQASINTKKMEKNESTGEAINDPTLTNERIRELLNLFDKSSYIGYTATPYANIFIHSKTKHDRLGPDLFPRNFIFSLNRPDDYIGPEEYFGLQDNEDGEPSETLPLNNCIKDSELIFPSPHKKDLMVTQIPHSLKIAVKKFLLASTARMLRQTSNPHNSMLVHVTRYTAVQGKVSVLIQKELQKLKNRIGDSNDDLDDLHKLWDGNKEPNDQYGLSFTNTTKKLIQLNRAEEKDIHSWAEIKQLLPKMIQKIQVKEINGAAKDTLQYKQAEEAAEGKNLPWERRGIHIIAVGGDKLSRGLTLEGLTISYYLRPSGMYDTLMQMGRWFGYRSGYLDLCRIFTLKEITSWFQQIATAEKDLKEQFIEMANSGATPEEFGLAVREDPGYLLVTNAGKRRDTLVFNLSYSGKCPETIVLRGGEEVSNHNLEILNGLVKSVEIEGERDITEEQNYHWKKVPKKLIQHFLRGYKGHFSGIDSTSIADFIQLQSSKDLEHWDVVIINKKDSARYINCGEYEFGTVQRKCTTRDDNKITIQRIVNRTDEMLDFIKPKRISLQKLYKEENHGKISITGSFIRRFRPRSRGLLIIYGVSDTENDDQEKYYGGVGDFPYYGFGVSFPKPESYDVQFETIRRRANSVDIEERF